MDQQFCSCGRKRQAWRLEAVHMSKSNQSQQSDNKRTLPFQNTIAESCMMTVCDCKKGYWHQELDEASSFLTTFNTEIEHFRYTVMSFGATIAGDVFQCKLDQCFGHIQNVIVITDDIMVVGRQCNHRDHDQAHTTLLETARKCNIRLNHDKLQYKQEEVDFFGETYTTNGSTPAQIKVKAINEMPTPTCKKQVQSFIGMINYFSKFSGRLSELVESITELCKDKIPFNWGPSTKKHSST